MRCVALETMGLGLGVLRMGLARRLADVRFRVTALGIRRDGGGQEGPSGPHVAPVTDLTGDRDGLGRRGAGELHLLA